MSVDREQIQLFADHCRALQADLEQAERQRDAYVDALAHERSLNESVVAPMRDRLAKVPALVEALYEISEGVHDGSRDPAFVANDALADYEDTASAGEGT